MTEQHEITAGQVYRSADPRDSIRIRITSYTRWDARASVVDAVTGQRPREILVRQLHASPVTVTGRRRRTGYVLERVPSEPEARQDGARQ